MHTALLLNYVCREKSKMRKNKLVKRTITGVLASTILLAPVVEPMDNVFVETKIHAETTKNEFLIEDGVLLRYEGKGGDVVVPEGVTRIEDFVFCEASSKETYGDDEQLEAEEERLNMFNRGRITSITLPSSLQSIGSNAFRGCRELKEVYIPDSVTEIEAHAFSKCEDH